MMAGQMKAADCRYVVYYLHTASKHVICTVTSACTNQQPDLLPLIEYTIENLESLRKRLGFVGIYEMVGRTSPARGEKSAIVFEPDVKEDSFIELQKAGRSIAKALQKILSTELRDEYSSDTLWGVGGTMTSPTAAPLCCYLCLEAVAKVLSISERFAHKGVAFGDKKFMTRYLGSLKYDEHIEALRKLMDE